MSEYRPLGMSCVHCGKELAAKRVYYSSVSIVGLHSLEYVHRESGKADCWIKKAAQPYDGWKASAAYDAAEPVEQDAT